MFEPLPSRFSFPDAEQNVLKFWREKRIFEQSLERRRGADKFVFYEGPPTANGLPHPGHCLTRAMKDLFPRYQTMCGKLVERKAGWDTHGLPVEVEVCKELGIHTKEEIEAYGIEKFNLKCIQSVFRYTQQWEEMTRRLGFWVNLDEAYVTYHRSYVESVWWGLKQLFDRGLLYQGHKVVWWWAQGGTALSSGEVGEGYRTVDDPSIYVKFPLVADGDAGTQRQRDAGGATGSSPASAEYNRCPVSLLVWTTTPWTLVSNHFAAVNPDLEYALVHDPELDEYLYVANDLVETISKKVKRELTVEKTVPGTELVGLHYEPPFPDLYYAKFRYKSAPLENGGEETIGWRVTAADFVTIESGSGIVHEAPAFGEVDFELLQSERQRFVERDAIPLINAVAPNGEFTDEAPQAYRGRWVKDCDKDITRELKERGLLYHQEVYRHEYPFCPRAENDALIQYARRSWFVRTSEFKDEFLANNREIHWLPDHIKEGRFGDFLRNNVDWALSRERYWGTPLPVWVCEQSGRMEAIASYDELRAKPGATDNGFWETKQKEHNHELPDHLRVHRPYIDEWIYDSPFEPGAKMRRVTEVIDCWWDAGSMPFAQWGYPHLANSPETVAERMPADFISEAIDQTRGWFYGLLAINTLLFGATGEDARPAPGYPLPYRTCIVLGHLMGEDGLKMSKRKKNYREPAYIFDHYGADAMRWYFFSAQTPWTSVRFQEDAIRDAQREFLVRLYNVFSFFNIYANIDGFKVQEAANHQSGTDWRPATERGELDRWAISELHRTTRAVRAAMDRFENFPAAQRLKEFVDGLSNWYVRRSRDRFWTGEKTQDKWDAYNTLYECLLSTAKLIAPFTPFLAEIMYRNLAGAAIAAGGAPESVHLSDFPVADEALIDAQLVEEMDLVRQIASLGRAARSSARLKVRQPLDRVEIILARHEHEQWLQSHTSLIAEELNVKTVEFTAEADHYVHYEVKPNFKAIGPAYGKLAPKIAGVLKQLKDPAAARRDLLESGELHLTVEGREVSLTPEQVEIRLEAKEGWTAAQGRGVVVVLSTEISDELKREGVVRELIHHIQAARKELDLPYEARIHVQISASDEFREIVEEFAAQVRSECLADEVRFDAPADASPLRVEGHDIKLAVRRAA